MCDYQTAPLPAPLPAPAETAPPNAEDERGGARTPVSGNRAGAGPGAVWSERYGRASASGAASPARGAIPLVQRARVKRRGERAMKSHTEYLTMNIPSKMAFLNITPQVEEAIRKSGVKEGLVLCNSMHITSSVFINDDERGLHHDFGKWLEELAPFNPDPNHYHHNRTGEDNADARLQNGRSWAARSSWRSPRGSSTSARGNRSSTANSTATATSGWW